MSRHTRYKMDQACKSSNKEEGTNNNSTRKDSTNIDDTTISRKYLTFVVFTIFVLGFSISKYFTILGMNYTYPTNTLFAMNHTDSADTNNENTVTRINLSNLIIIVFG